MSDSKEARQLPLHDFHRERGAKMVPFAGWLMPVSYTSILEEHRAVREGVGCFDVSHMGEVRVTGPDAARFLDRMATNRIEKLAVGRAVYTPFCLPKGGVIDDVIISRLDADDFLVVVNASNREKDLRWMEGQSDGFRVEIADTSEDWALLALQGPEALALARGFWGDDVPVKRFSVKPVSWHGEPLLLSGTGYTGEDGLEVFCPVALATVLAEQLEAAAGDRSTFWCGLGSRDSLRIEAGFPLYGQELTEEWTPFASGIGWTVKLDKGGFIGQEVLRAESEHGEGCYRLLHFLLEGKRIARPGTVVSNAEGKEVGKVCSGTLSPLLERPIGSARVLTSSLDEPLSVDLRGHRMELEVRKPPLHL